MRLWRQHGWGRIGGGVGACLAASVLAVAPPAAAQANAAAAPQTAAGTVVANTADLGWAIGAERGATRSNTDRLIVAERLDLRLAPGPTAPAGSAALPVLLINGGNGVEAFALAAATLDDPSRPLKLVVDADRDGRCDATVDRELIAGRTAPLAAGAALQLLVCDTPGPVRVSVKAATGSGVPGTTYAGAGDGGGDAVVGPSGAAATLVVGDGGEGAAAEPVLVKSQSVVAPDGSARAMVGATITYTLAAQFAADSSAAEIEDPVPAGTRLVPGSLTLDGAPLTDTADADAGEVAAGAIRVRLGDVAAGTDHRVTFAVIILP